MRWVYLGRVGYREALDLQQRIREAMSRGECPDTLLMLEHPPVITLGRSADASNVLISRRQREERGVDLVWTGRGGDVTYHGPGQLVGYPLRRIGRAVRAHVLGMTEAVVSVIAAHGIESWWDERHPGVWTDRGKIAAVGVDATGGIAMHGFALNISTRLEDYQMIIPCGYQAPVTSLQAILGSSGTPSAEQVAQLIARQLGLSYGCRVDAITMEELEEL